MDVGLLVGRFQPFHLGHLSAVRLALTKVKFLYIIVGSAEKSHQIENPFTAGERIRMIKAALDAADIDCHQYLIIPIPDAGVHSIWVTYVDSYANNYDVVFSNDPLTLRLFREKGVKVMEVPYDRREVYSATEVRRRMVLGGKWDELVPISVSSIIQGIDGIQRLRDLAFAKTKQTEY
jgi:nicotinamide-nucleotide adenylyltransferase